MRHPDVSTPWWYSVVRDWRLRMWLETFVWPSAARGISLASVPADASHAEAAPDASSALAGEVR